MHVVFPGSRNGRGSRLSLVKSSASSDYLVIPVNLPHLRWPSVDHLCANGLFLLEGDGAIFVRVGEEPEPSQLGDLFGVPDLRALPAVRVTSCCALDVVYLICVSWRAPALSSAAR